MIFLKAKDIKNRNLYHKKYLNRKIQKLLFINLLNNNKTDKKMKRKLLFFFLKQNKISKVRITSRCIITNRSRGVFRPFNVSRIVLRNMIHLGIVPGYGKAVW